MEYGSVVWDPHWKKDAEILEKTQSRAARWICRDYSYRSSVTEMRKGLGLEELVCRRKKARLLMMYKILNGHVAITPEDLGIKHAYDRTRTIHTHKLREIDWDTAERRRSFVPKTIIEWNKLPACIAEAGSIDIFKSQLAQLDTPV